MKKLQESAKLLEDRQSEIFFKVSDAFNELEGPPLVKNFALISPDELETTLSKLRGKWVEEFDSLSNFSKNMCMWTIDYVNLNHNISINISEICDDFLEIE